MNIRWITPASKDVSTNDISFLLCWKMTKTQLWKQLLLRDCTLWKKSKQLTRCFSLMQRKKIGISLRCGAISKFLNRRICFKCWNFCKWGIGLGNWQSQPILPCGRKNGQTFLWRKNKLYTIVLCVNAGLKNRKTQSHLQLVMVTTMI